MSAWVSTGHAKLQNIHYRLNTWGKNMLPDHKADLFMKSSVIKHSLAEVEQDARIQRKLRQAAKVEEVIANAWKQVDHVKSLNK
jgi:hypothetical protein